MKLVNYESQEQLNTINGQIHNYANEIAYGADQSGLRSIANGIANINEQYQKKLNQSDAHKLFSFAKGIDLSD